MVPDDDPDRPEHESAEPAASSSDRDQTAGAGAGELRGKDLLARPRQEIEANLDPATMAELASWFDRPSAALVAEEAEVDAESQAVEERRQRLAAEADPRLLAILYRHNDIPDLLLPVRPEIRLHLDERVIPPHVQSALDRMHSDDAPPDAREYDLPPDIAAALAKDNAPQAILRDLYRPVEEYERRLVAAFDRDEEAPTYQVGTAMKKREPIEWITRAADALVAARAQFRAIVDKPWEEHYVAVQARLRANREAKS